MNTKVSIRILHLEDNSNDAELIRRSFTDAGIPCDIHLVDSRDALRSTIESMRFDLILSDSTLRDMDGTEALELVRGRGDSTPFIFVSGRAEDEQRVQHMKALGATDFVSKADITRVVGWAQGLCGARAANASGERDDTAVVERLVAVIQALSLSRSLESVQAIVRTATRNLTGADGATFVLRQGEYCYYADEDAIAPLWKGRRFPVTACISGWSMLNRQSAVIEDIYADSRIPHDAYRPTFVKSLVMVPIRTLDPIGAIGSYWAKQHRPGAFQVRILEALANTTAVALDNIRIHSNLENLVATRTAQLEATNQELESFSYAVSHDLRAPLRHIDGFARIMAADTGNVFTDGTRRCLQQIDRATKRMGQLIEDLLKLSRTTRVPVERQRIDLSALSSDVALKLSQAEPGRTVEFKVAENMEAYGDPRLIRIVMENLLSNAWKFTSKVPQPVIEVGATRADDGRKVYFVRDNGAGFSMKYSSRLFGAFQRMHSENDFPGTGLGLATVQRVIHKHCGKVWVTAEIDRGACFFFTLGSESADASPPGRT